MLFETERFELIQFLATADLDEDEYDLVYNKFVLKNSKEG